MATLAVGFAPCAVAENVRRAAKVRVRETTGKERVTVEVAAAVAQDL